MDFLDIIRRWFNIIEDTVRHARFFRVLIRNYPRTAITITIILVPLLSYMLFRKNTLRARIRLLRHVIEGDDQLILNLDRLLKPNPWWLPDWVSPPLL
ncbi:unnamed protein product [Rhizophagus irregularis]|uniref:Uncharacterized protein n=1 Tax=Rhizophagus irregularis TaxID=588596 RepID=A0A915YY56_9GLOM|nr:unnamed protein product [Rhizophagus irregularis]CAB5354073.1 unnamed protein product [Rhizophagus irregularis]